MTRLMNKIMYDVKQEIEGKVDYAWLARQVEPFNTLKNEVDDMLAAKAGAQRGLGHIMWMKIQLRK